MAAATTNDGNATRDPRMRTAGAGQSRQPHPQPQQPRQQAQQAHHANAARQGQAQADLQPHPPEAEHVGMHGARSPAPASSKGATNGGGNQSVASSAEKSNGQSNPAYRLVRQYNLSPEEEKFAVLNNVDRQSLLHLYLSQSAHITTPYSLPLPSHKARPSEAECTNARDEMLRILSSMKSILRKTFDPASSPAHSTTERLEYELSQHHPVASEITGKWLDERLENSPPECRKLLKETVHDAKFSRIRAAIWNDAVGAGLLGRASDTDEETTAVASAGIAHRKRTSADSRASPRQAEERQTKEPHVTNDMTKVGSCASDSKLRADANADAEVQFIEEVPHDKQTSTPKEFDGRKGRELQQQVGEQDAQRLSQQQRQHVDTERDSPDTRELLSQAHKQPQTQSASQKAQNQPDLEGTAAPLQQLEPSGADDTRSGPNASTVGAQGVLSNEERLTSLLEHYARTNADAIELGDKISQKVTYVEMRDKNMSAMQKLDSLPEEMPRALVRIAWLEPKQSRKYFISSLIKTTWIDANHSPAAQAATINIKYPKTVDAALEQEYGTANSQQRKEALQQPNHSREHISQQQHLSRAPNTASPPPPRQKEPNDTQRRQEQSHQQEQNQGQHFQTPAELAQASPGIAPSQEQAQQQAHEIDQESGEQKGLKRASDMPAEDIFSEVDHETYKRKKDELSHLQQQSADKWSEVQQTERELESQKKTAREIDQELKHKQEEVRTIRKKHKRAIEGAGEEVNRLEREIRKKENGLRHIENNILKPVATNEEEMAEEVIQEMERSKKQAENFKQQITNLRERLSTVSELAQDPIRDE